MDFRTLTRTEDAYFALGRSVHLFAKDKPLIKLCKLALFFPYRPSLELLSEFNKLSWNSYRRTRLLNGLEIESDYLEANEHRLYLPLALVMGFADSFLKTNLEVRRYVRQDLSTATQIDQYNALVNWLRNEIFMSRINDYGNYPELR